MEKRVQETPDSTAPETPAPEIQPVMKKIKTEGRITHTYTVPKTEEIIAESHWQKLPPEMQEKIEDIAARKLHRERLEKANDQEENSLLIEHCFVCGKEEWGMLWTPCCQKPAHLECCPVPIHVHSALRHVCMILDIEGFLLLRKRVEIREVGWCDMNGFLDSFHFKPITSFQSLSPKDKRTVSYVFHNIHALPFTPRLEENAADGCLVDFVVKT